MMDILMSKTCCSHKKWNKIANDIKLVFHSSTRFLIFVQQIALKTVKHFWDWVCSILRQMMVVWGRGEGMVPIQLRPVTRPIQYHWTTCFIVVSVLVWHVQYQHTNNINNRLYMQHKYTVPAQETIMANRFYCKHELNNLLICTNECTIFWLKYYTNISLLYNWSKNNRSLTPTTSLI